MLPFRLGRRHELLAQSLPKAEVYSATAATGVGHVFHWVNSAAFKTTTAFYFSSKRTGSNDCIPQEEEAASE